jgi:putative transcriptional regulator
MLTAEVIGQRIKHLRTMANISQETLAKYLGITRQSVCNYETGDMIPSDETKISIAKYFGKPVQEIFFDEEVNW